MPLFQHAIFHTTVADLRELPTDALCEVAFAGRSNAAKSTAINALANHTRLAFVSKTPGRTQHLNYFRIDEGKYFVDLPGYGYAKAPQDIRAQWEGLLGPYLQQRPALRGLLLIMDSRHPLTELDQQMIRWFAATGKPIHVLLSKADKLSRQEQTQVCRHVQAALTELAEHCSAQVFSGLKKFGVREAEAVLAGWLDLPFDESSLPPPGVRSGRRTPAKRRAAVGWTARQAVSTNKR